MGKGGGDVREALKGDGVCREIGRKGRGKGGRMEDRGRDTARRKVRKREMENMKGRKR